MDETNLKKDNGYKESEIAGIRSLILPPSMKHWGIKEESVFGGKKPTLNTSIEDLVNYFSFWPAPYIILKQTAAAHGLPKESGLSTWILSLKQEDRILLESNNLEEEKRSFLEKEVNLLGGLYDSYKLLLHKYTINTGEEFIEWLPGDSFNRKQVPKEYLKNIDAKLVLGVENFDWDNAEKHPGILTLFYDPNQLRGILSYFLIAQYYNDHPEKFSKIELNPETLTQIESLKYAVFNYFENMCIFKNMEKMSKSFGSNMGFPEWFLTAKGKNYLENHLYPDLESVTIGRAMDYINSNKGLLYHSRNSLIYFLNDLKNLNLKNSFEAILYKNPLSRLKQLYNEECNEFDEGLSREMEITHPKSYFSFNK